MKTITQKEIEERVARNKEKYKNEIEKVVNEIKGKGLQRGRVRPRDPVEADILDGFKKTNKVTAYSVFIYSVKFT